MPYKKSYKKKRIYKKRKYSTSILRRNNYISSRAGAENGPD